MFSCTFKETSNAEIPIVNEEVTLTDSINKELTLLYDCTNSYYSAYLYEFINRDSLDYFLKVKLIDSNIEKVFTLDLVSGKTRLKHCNEEYIVLSSFCGGPCYGDDLVFINEDRIESFSYAMYVHEKPNLILHIQNEMFEEIILHNLDTHKEQKIDISDCWDLNYHPCSIDSLYIINEKLILEYLVDSTTNGKKKVDISSIL